MMIDEIDDEVKSEIKFLVKEYGSMITEINSIEKELNIIITRKQEIEAHHQLLLERESKLKMELKTKFNIESLSLQDLQKIIEK